ncbi:GntR family transcriptional regulator [Ruminococcus gauvreauii]|uniref:GntR family transcriptional regulator n=1 Tax=Ruminococcus gauvreauii TaxID=438033 RepID=A0ABY5VES7_9FIRM|nr:GntR family transcriptional regulator [Ruminococcus gauvreauii]UWP58862.1 GntR family transcriptional regulator [Ruminococcus gauvreauii]
MAKYLQVSEWILSNIAENNLKQGDNIPPELQLSQTLHVSRQTVRKAIEHLVSRGILTTIQGSGTYVAHPPKLRAAPVSSQNIAVITTYLDSYIFPQKISAIYDALARSGFLMNLLGTNNSAETEHYVLSSLLDKDFAGIILEPSRSTLPRIQPELYRQLKETFPIVLIDCNYSDISLPRIALDDREGGYLATKHLLEHGHRDIMHIGKLDDLQGIYRYQGYLRALQEYQIIPRETDVLWYTNETSPSMFLDVQEERVLACLENHSAVYCYNDLMASALLAFLTDHGIRVPDDLSVVGYDDSPLARQGMGLTTVVHPSVDIGLKTAENLVKLIHDPTFDANYTFTPKLVERDTVKDHT